MVDKTNLTVKNIGLVEDDSDDSEDVDFKPSEHENDSDSDSLKTQSENEDENEDDAIPDVDPDTQKKIQDLWDQIKNNKYQDFVKIQKNDKIIQEPNNAVKDIKQNEKELKESTELKEDIVNKPDIKKTHHLLRKSHLASLAAKMGLSDQAKKLTTLEKSMLDWKENVAKMGDSASLKHHNKAGYVDKMEFLSKTNLKTDDFIDNSKNNNSNKRKRLK